MSNLVSKWWNAAVLWQEGRIARIEALSQEHINNKSKRKQDGVLNDLIQKNLLRNVVHMREWREGLEAWENIESPDRSWMHEVYQEILLDPQVAAKINTADMKISASEFVFANPDTNEEDLKTTELFKTQWFAKFLREAMMSDFMGHTLFQFPASHDGNFKFDANDLEIIPRWLVLPNGTLTSNYKGVVIPSPGAQDGVLIEEGRAAKRLLPIGDKKAFGMFAAIAPLYIYKKNAMSFWSSYQQRYGEPTIAIKMDTENTASRKEYSGFLKNRGTKSGLLLRKDDSAELLEANKHDAFNLYKEMITYCDEGISKVLEGQTMTADSGGGKTKGDVHADVAKIFHLGRLKKLAFFVNDSLIPYLEREYGFDFKGNVFKWREFKDVDAEVENIMKLSTNFEMSNEEVKNRTGYVVLKMKEDKIAADQRAGYRYTSPDKDDKTDKKRP